MSLSALVGSLGFQDKFVAAGKAQLQEPLKRYEQDEGGQKHKRFHNSHLLFRSLKPSLHPTNSASSIGTEHARPRSLGPKPRRFRILRFARGNPPRIVPGR